MKMNLLDTAVALADQDLLTRLPVLAAHERSATAELVAHLAALRLRPTLYAAQGYGSLFAYCRDALRLSEDAASNRIHAARACLRFPRILDLLASGEISLSAVRMLRPHLTTDNHERVLSRARNARRIDIERLVAELAPRADVPSSVRRLALPRVSGPLPSVGGRSSQPELPVVTSVPGPTACVRAASTEDLIIAQKETLPAGIDPAHRGPADVYPTRMCPPEVEAASPAHVSRSVVQPLSPERYRVQFTIGQDTHDILRRLQTLLRREIPDGDAGVIFARALHFLHGQVEAAKFGRVARPGSATRRQLEPGHDRTGHDPTAIAERAAHEPTAVTPPAIPAYEKRIRPGADPSTTSSDIRSVARAQDPDSSLRKTPAMKSAVRASSRYIPNAVKRAVWYRDRGQCAFVAVSGQRCAEREFLELHHIQPYALKGPATAANIALRCRRHNAHEAEAVFGARAASTNTRAHARGGR